MELERLSIKLIVGWVYEYCMIDHILTAMKREHKSLSFDSNNEWSLNNYHKFQNLTDLADINIQNHDVLIPKSWNQATFDLLQLISSNTLRVIQITTGTKHELNCLN